MNETHRDHVEETLRRLGIEELEERLELSPIVLTDGEVPPEDTGGCCRNFCECDMVLPKEVFEPWVGR